jgi:hypothetical protein
VQHLSDKARCELKRILADATLFSLHTPTTTTTTTAKEQQEALRDVFNSLKLS